VSATASSATTHTALLTSIIACIESCRLTHGSSHGRQCVHAAQICWCTTRVTLVRAHVDAHRHICSCCMSWEVVPPSFICVANISSTHSHNSPRVLHDRFWQMVWTAGSTCIVMVTNEVICSHVLSRSPPRTPLVELTLRPCPLAKNLTRPRTLARVALVCTVHRSKGTNSSATAIGRREIARPRRTEPCR
jgi:hypothetical protein